MVELVSRSREARLDKNLREEVILMVQDANQLTYDQLSRQMTELLVKMEDISNKEVLPLVVSLIKTNTPKEDGWVQVLGSGNKNERCWCLYGKGIDVKNDCINCTWWLLKSDGKLVVSRHKSYDRWSYDDTSSFGSHTIEDTDTYHHNTIYIARLFYGLLRVGEKCGISENIISFWKKNFDELYGQYQFLKETQLIQTQTDKFNR